MSNIGQNIKNRRLELGLTADQLANRLQKSRATIYRYESTDADNMPIGILEPLAKALSTTPAELMGWGGGAVKTNTKMTFDDDPPMQALTQAYLRRPSLVQDEIIRRLEGLDATFSHNVSKLLQASGDINGFMHGTGLPFATVGEFMQGKTVRTTPAEAERIATYFGANVVDLFFIHEPTESVKPSPKTESKQELACKSEMKLRPELSSHCKAIFRYIKQKSKKNISIMLDLEDYKKLLLDPRVDSFITNALNVTEKIQSQYMTFDPNPIYKAIAHEIIHTDFIQTYVDGEEAGMEDLLDTIRNNIQ